MASSKLIIEHMGTAGVNVDKNPLELDDDELTQAQNVSPGTATGNASLRKRPGLLAFNAAAITAGAVLGGTDLPLRTSASSGIRSLYIGRGPLS